MKSIQIGNWGDFCNLLGASSSGSSKDTVGHQGPGDNSSSQLWRVFSQKVCQPWSCCHGAFPAWLICCELKTSLNQMPQIFFLLSEMSVKKFVIQLSLFWQEYKTKAKGSIHREKEPSKPWTHPGLLLRCGNPVQQRWFSLHSSSLLKQRFAGSEAELFTHPVQVILQSWRHDAVIHAVVCLQQLVWIFRSAQQQLTSQPQKLVHAKSFESLFDQVSSHLNQKCISTTKDLGKFQKNHKPPWK